MLEDLKELDIRNPEETLTGADLVSFLSETI